MADEKPPTNLFAVTDEELRGSYTGPAVLANRMIVTKTAAGVRLTFMEALPEKVPSVFRASVILGYQDAVALKELLADQLKEIEAQLKAATEAEAAKKAAEVPPTHG